jgi:hypothetical protein
LNSFFFHIWKKMVSHPFIKNTGVHPAIWWPSEAELFSPSKGIIVETLAREDHHRGDVLSTCTTATVYGKLLLV